MAFPAAPAESGTAKIHFLTTDGNAAAGWFGVTEGVTGTGANTVGFAAVATHVHDDAAAAPGGLNTTATDVPIVLVGAVRDDALGGLTPAAGDAVYLLVDANGALWTHDDALDAALIGSELQVDVVAPLPAGTNNIGDVDVLTLPALAAGTNNIGDVDVLTIAAGDNNIGNVDIVMLPSANLGQRAMAASLSIVPANDIADTTYIGDIKFGESLPAGGNNIGDVDVLSIIPGTGGTNLGKAIDSSGGGTDTGVAALAIRDDSLTTLTPADGDYVALRVNSTGALHVTGGGGGTEYAVDDALGATPIGSLAIAIRDDVLSALGPIEGDAVGLRVDANGALWTHDDALDEALVGSELQVDVVASLPAGTNAIGKLAENTGVDIGDVDILSVITGTGATNLGKAEDAAHGNGDTGVMLLAVRRDTASSLVGADNDYIPLTTDSDGKLYVNIADGGNSITVDAAAASFGAKVAGDVAHDAADANGPVKIGGRSQEPTAQPDEVADEDRVDALFDRNGYQRVRGDFDPKSAVINHSNSGDNTIIAAAGAGKRIVVWCIKIVSDGTTDVRWEDGAGGTAFDGQVPLQAREGYVQPAGGMVPLYIGTANTLLNLELTAAVNVHGSVSYSVMDD